MAGKKNRTQLQALFKSGAKPSQGDFRDFIDSVLNINDDGIEKPPGADTPLKISAQGDSENLLDFYVEDLNTWRLNQKPTGANPGLNFEAGGLSKLFVESGTGNLGLSTTQPIAKLHIQQSGSQDALRIEDEASDTTPLVVDTEGKVGIGIAIPDCKLQVEQGELKVRASHNRATADIGRFYAQNMTQGVGVGYNQIAAIGSNQNQDIRLIPKGGGKLVVEDSNLELAGNQQIAFTNNDTSNNLKLQLWGGYGLGINDSTLFYAANGQHSWRDANGTNERMVLTTAANGSLAVKGTGESSFAGSLSIQGHVKASGTLYAGGNPLAYENYEIYVRGSAIESTEGDTPTLEIANISMGIRNNRGLNTVILNPNGTLKKKNSHDVYADAARWNTWANWVNANAAAGDLVAVASKDALKNAPTGGSAENLLRKIVALKAFRAANGGHRAPYALLFIKDRTGAMEISQPYKGANAHLKTTYYELLNYGNSAVMVGMIVMWSGAVANIPTGWALCDGNNGTPDLRDRFIVAAGNSYNPGNNGNPDTHQHAVNPPQTNLSINNAGSHTHSFPSGWYKRNFSNGSKSGIDTNGNDIKKQNTQSSGSHAHSGTVNIAQFNSGSSSGPNRPKWYALCLIMKV